jgi:hypothetical protein
MSRPFRCDYIRKDRANGFVSEKNSSTFSQPTINSPNQPSNKLAQLLSPTGQGPQAAAFLHLILQLPQNCVTN